MPGMTGLALVKKARAAGITLPVIMATGGLPPEDLFIRHPWLQPAAVLMKPYSVEQLLGIVRKLLCATADVCEQSTPPSNQRRQSSVNDLQL